MKQRVCWCPIHWQLIFTSRCQCLIPPSAIHQLLDRRLLPSSNGFLLCFCSLPAVAISQFDRLAMHFHRLSDIILSTGSYRLLRHPWNTNIEHNTDCRATRPLGEMLRPAAAATRGGERRLLWTLSKLGQIGTVTSAGAEPRELCEIDGE